MAVSIQFINPTPQEGISPLKLFLHNFYGLGRTNALRCALYPTIDSLDGLLKKVWANAHEQTFSSVEDAQKTISNELELIHPIALSQYTTAIKAAATLEQIKNLAESSFSHIDQEAKKIQPSITAYFDEKMPNPSNLNMLEVGRFLRQITTKCSESESLEEIQSFIKNDTTFQKIIACDSLKDKYGALITAFHKNDLSTLIANLTSTKDSDMKFLSLKKREQITNCLKDTWELLKSSSFTSTDEAVALVRERLEPLNLPSLTELYTRDLSLAKVANIAKRAESYLVDLFSIKTPNNLIHLNDGQTAYPKLIQLNRSELIRGFVKHFNTQEEIEHHQLYSLFLNSPESKECMDFFALSVPNASMLSQGPLTYTHPFPSNQKEVITPIAQENHARSLISAMASANTPRNGRKVEDEKKFQAFVKESPLGFFDYIHGTNLEDFFASKYQALRLEDKETLFTQLGSIAFLDLILGNLDRLIPLDPEEPEWETAAYCNLGNLMISTDKKFLYAIDNGIGDGKNTPQTEEEKEKLQGKYLKFLEKELSSENFETKIAAQIVSLLKKTLQENSKAEELTEQLEGEETETDDEFRPITCQIRKGILSMKQLLLEKGISAWNEGGFKDSLNPQLRENIQSKLNIFQNSIMQASGLET